MAEPCPLIQTPEAVLDWSVPGTPTASDFDDIYFSTSGGLDETRAVFLKGCNLPDGWVDQTVFTIAELGFGSGLNFLATWQMWDTHRRPAQRLHFVSFEKFPFDRQQLTQALAAWPELEPFSRRLIAAWPGRVRGIHRLEFGSLTLTLVHDDVVDGLNQVDGLRADAWFLDGFGPSSNPAMWSPEVMTQIAQRSAPGAKLATFSVAGVVRRALSAAGFHVRKAPGFGKKRHRLEAELESVPSPAKPAIDRALIVGAGIAGRSLARALDSRGIAFDIIDSREHPAASDNPAALIKPRFDLQDRPESRFFLAAYLHALRVYPEACILDRGVHQRPKTEKEAVRFEKLATQSALGEAHMTFSNGALNIHSALVINPQLAFNNFDIREEAFDPVKARADYSHIFLAAGYGLQEIAPDLHLRLSRGQLSWAESVWEAPTAYGGYAINLNGAALVGATHDRLDARDPFSARNEDDDRNLAALSEVSQQEVVSFDRPSRASVRVTSRDTLPILANLGESQWVITGLGSRGFTFAPLLAEALIADLCGEVGPLDQQVRALFSAPTRYT